MSYPPTRNQPHYSPYPYGSQPGYTGPEQAYTPLPPTNGMAIASLICSVLGIGLVGVILGHIALNQIRDRGGQGRGLAIGGLVLGYLEVVFVGGILIVFLGMMALGIGVIATA